MHAVPIEKGSTALWHGYEWEIVKVTDETINLSSGFQTRPMTREAFFDDYMSGKILLDSTPSPEKDSPFIRANKRIESLTKKERKQLRNRKHFCDALRLETHPCSPKTRHRIIEEVYKEKKLKKKPSIGALYYWWLRYDKSGFHPLSLLDSNHLKGNRTSRLDPLVVEYILKYLKERFLVKKPPTKVKFMESLEDYLKTFNLKCPSYKTVFRNLRNNYSDYDICVLQYGRTVANKKFHADLGYIDATRFLELVEMDARKMKLVVVDDDLNFILGQPYIMMLKDKATKAIIGFFLYFGGESADAAIRAVLQAIFTKDHFNRKYPALKTLWLAFGLPEFILLDAGRGFVSDRFEELSFVLGFHFGTTKVRAPWLKAAIESAFSFVKSGFESGLPGEVRANARFESEYKHFNEACIRFSKLRELLTRWIVDVHNNKVSDEDGKSPNDRIIELTKKRRPYLPANALSVMEYMGTKRRGTISPVKGIKFLGAWYNSEELQALGRLLKQKQGHRKIEFFTNDGDLGAIRVINPLNKTRLTVFAKRFDFLSGKSVKLIKRIRKHISDKAKRHPSQKLVKEASVEIFKEALAEMKQLKKKSKKSGKPQKLTSTTKELLLDKAMKDAEQDDDSFKNDLIESFGFNKALTPQVQQFPEPDIDKETGEILEDTPDSLLDELLEDHEDDDDEDNT